MVISHTPQTPSGSKVLALSLSICDEMDCSIPVNATVDVKFINEVPLAFPLVEHFQEDDSQMITLSASDREKDTVLLEVVDFSPNVKIFQYDEDPKTRKPVPGAEIYSSGHSLINGSVIKN